MVLMILKLAKPENKKFERFFENVNKQTWNWNMSIVDDIHILCQMEIALRVGNFSPVLIPISCKY